MAHPTGFEPVTSAFGERWVDWNIQRKQQLGNAVVICEAFVPFTNRQKSPENKDLGAGEGAVSLVLHPSITTSNI